MFINYTSRKNFCTVWVCLLALFVSINTDVLAGEKGEAKPNLLRRAYNSCISKVRMTSAFMGALVGRGRKASPDAQEFIYNELEWAGVPNCRSIKLFCMPTSGSSCNMMAIKLSYSFLLCIGNEAIIYTSEDGGYRKKSISTEEYFSPQEFVEAAVVDMSLEYLLSYKKHLLHELESARENKGVINRALEKVEEELFSYRAVLHHEARHLRQSTLKYFGLHLAGTVALALGAHKLVEQTGCMEIRVDPNLTFGENYFNALKRGERNELIDLFIGKMAVIIVTMNLTRINEWDADEHVSDSIEHLVALRRFFEKVILLQEIQAGKADADGIIRPASFTKYYWLMKIPNCLFGSHPLPQDRIKRLNERIAKIKEGVAAQAA